MEEGISLSKGYSTSCAKNTDNRLLSNLPRFLQHPKIVHIFSLASRDRPLLWKRMKEALPHCALKNPTQLLLSGDVRIHLVSLVFSHYDLATRSILKAASRNP